MFKKRYLMLMILSLLMCMVAVSSVSAVDADNVADEELAVDAVDSDLAVDEVDDATLENIDDNNVISDVESQEVLAKDEDASGDVIAIDDSQEVLSGSPVYTKYNVGFYDTYYVVDEDDGGYVDFFINPNTDSSDYAYDFYFKVYDLNGNQKISKNFYSSTQKSYESYFIDSLAPGEYVMKLINYKDGHEYDSATLYVEDVVIPATITTSGYYSSFYDSKKKFTITVKDDYGYALSGVQVKVVFKKSGSTVTKWYTTGSDGKVSFVPPLKVGTWKATITTTGDTYIAKQKQNTFKITKSTVSVKIKKISQYQGINFYLKATVKNKAGKKVKEGKVQFKINGKTYNVAVKNGVATKKLKLNKVKKYKVTGKFKGTKNFKASKKVKSKVTIKKRYKTKVIVKSKFSGKYQGEVTVKIKVKTTNGKKVSGGYLAIVNKQTGGVSYAVVDKNGKVTLKFTLRNNYLGGNYYSSFYKKVVYSKFKFKYEPSSYKYKCSPYKTITIKENYKCFYCGKSKSHSHNMGSYLWNIYVS